MLATENATARACESAKTRVRASTSDATSCSSGATSRSPQWLYGNSRPEPRSTSAISFFENWNRFYDPSTGRYSAVDPLLLRPTPALPEVYRYAENNPVLFKDPTGLLVEGTQDEIQTTEYLAETAAKCAGGDEAACEENAGNLAMGVVAVAGAVAMVGATAAVEAGAVEAASGVARAGVEAVKAAGGRVVGAATAAATWLAKNVKVEGPSPGLAYMNGRIVGVTIAGKFNIRLEIAPIPGSGKDPVLHLNIGPSGRGKSPHIPLWRFKRPK